ncbi:hypothetical protein SDC9_202912 [bioreactor metagenome]|uniref:Uncharacterized protein n=1 Tax=bioreactor metagenome TaxID=1076179 RepID=A0A645IWH8_9ZZZZ
MHTLYIVKLHRLKTFEDIKRHQRYYPLPIWRELPYIITTILDTNRINPLRMELLKVSLTQVAATLAGKRIDFVGEDAVIKLCCIAFANEPEGIG